MNTINEIYKYIIIDKWYYLTSTISINLLSYLFKFISYRQLTEYISNINDDYLEDLNYKLGIFFIKFIIIHGIYNWSYYIMGNIVIDKLKYIFDKIINRLLYYKVDFFRNNNEHKINQLWFYLNSIELLIEKLILELPKITIYLMYYTYTIYNFSGLSLFIIIPTNLLVIYLLHPLSKKQYKYNKERIDLDLETKNILLEASSNIEFIKLNNKQEHEINKLNNKYNKLLYNKSNDKKISSILLFVSEVFDDILILTIYSIGVIHVVNRNMKPIELLYLAIHTGNFYYQLLQLKDIYNFYKRVTPKISVIKDILLYNKIEHITEENINLNLDKLDENIIKFTNINFGYEQNKLVLKNINFNFKLNKINVLLGANGSGKSTLIKLLLRLYDNYEGEIYLNNINIKEIPIKQLRNDIIFVLHEPAIFNDTVWNNITYGIDNITERDIINNCELLDSKRWIILNKNRHTGFRGKDLSGGERKKIQLLNILCKKSNIIIFDEPTNALDSNAIKWFIDFIKKLKEHYNKTIIIISHDIRISDVADNIIGLN